MTAADIDQHIGDVTALLRRTLDRTTARPLIDQHAGLLYDGRMLRARFAIRTGLAAGAPAPDLVRSAASVELVRSASLLHDAVTDDTGTHPDSQALWVNRKTSTDILVGDLMMCVAMSLLMDSSEAALIAEFVARIQEMCEAEAGHELLPGTAADWPAAVALARRRTGPLFAFAGFAAGNGIPALRAALRECGYRAGTAHQIAEDIGNGLHPGPDGRDRPGAAPADAVERLGDLCATSRDMLSPWPAVRDAWDDFLKEDLQPAIRALLPGTSPCGHERACR